MAAETGFRLSPQQERLWSLGAAGGPLRAQALFEVRGDIDPERLRQAALRSVARHEILRTSFRFFDMLRSPLQVVSDQVELDFAELELRDPCEAEALFESLLSVPLELAAGPRLQLRLLRGGNASTLLLLSAPALCLDGPSLRRLGREILAGCAGEPEPEEEPIQYADMADFFLQALEADETAAGRAWWRRLPGDFPEPRLPFLRERAAGPEGGEETFLVRVWPDLAARLGEVAGSLGGSVEDLLAAGWLALLARSGESGEVALGLVLDGRDHEGLEGALGPFARALPFVTGVEGNLELGELVHRVREIRGELRSWQDYFSWEGREPSRFAPFGFDFVPREEAACGRLSLSLLREHAPADRFALRLSCQETPQGLRLAFVRSLRDSSPEAARLLAERFQVLLESCVEAPRARIGDLEILGAAERHQLLFEANDARAADPTPVCAVHHLFEEWTDRTPEAVALEHAGSRLSYRELEVRSNQLAHHLLALGVGLEEPVAMALERSPEMVVALLAILKAGAAYLPVDPSHPAERRSLLLRKARAAVLLTRRAGERLAVPGVRVIGLEDEAVAVEARSGERPAVRVAPGNLAYVLFTSGSTGEPKGVMVPHSGLLSYLRWCARAYPVGPGTTAPVHSPLTFDLTVTSLLGPLTNGGRVLLLPEDSGLEALGDLLGRGGEWDLLKITPAHLDVIAGLLPRQQAVARVRTLVVGGEALRGESLGFWPDSETQVINEYGPTETVVGCCTFGFAAGERPRGMVPIGRPIVNARLHLLDGGFRPVPSGCAGELYVGGLGMARGYLGAPELTAERFVPDPFAGAGGETGARLYRTGDMARRRQDGTLEFLGRADHQVKIRGYRIEPGEIESVLGQHPAVREVVVVAREDQPGDRRLVAYLVAAKGALPGLGELEAFTRRKLPDPMVPAAFVPLAALPLTPNGKVDRAALPPPEPIPARAGSVLAEPAGDLEREIAAIWREVLGVERVGRHDNFFDLGGHSLLLARVSFELRERTGRRASMLNLLRHPTIAALAGFLEPGQAGAAPRPDVRAHCEDGAGRDIAVIGMSGRFPGAPALDRFWRNLRDGTESITFFSTEELEAAGVPRDDLERPDYVRAKGVLEEADRFDAGFFGFTPREAEITDPQHRVFLECAWEALEHAGQDPARSRGRIGVFAGLSANTYWRYLLSSPDVAASGMQIVMGNDKDFLPMRVSYKLGLTGPSVNVQSSCSTSLVAVHLACRSLRDGEADMALAGGVSVRLPQKAGYFFQEGGIVSPDGHCRAFDAEARGTLAGNGVGVVVLKRLRDALEDGDTIHAVIKGSAVNNDGLRKAGFTAPSVDGQAAAIRDALADAGIEPETVSYVEAHGTATALGDPIEVAALVEAFGPSPVPCALGSVKTNIGHLDAAAGVTGLIKAILALEHREIPPSLHYRKPNPEIDFAGGRFYVNAELAVWPVQESPRRAGVSSFGIGGTNAHVVLEEAPPAPEPVPARPWQLLVLSARTSTALETMTGNLAVFLESGPEPSLADAAWTLQCGRRAFEHRRIAVCRDREEAVAVLREQPPERVRTGLSKDRPPRVAFLFPGQGSQSIGMGRELYAAEPVFRAEIDRCAEILRPHLGLDLRRALGMEESRPAAELDQTWLTQPALFAVEYALARLWRSWGVAPQAMAGHSVGEYVAACLAGVFSLEDGLALIAERGRLLQRLPAGAMLSVGLSEEEILPYLDGTLSLAAVNGTQLCVLSGPPGAVDVLEEDLAAQGVEVRRLSTSHAFHSSMMEPAVEPFREAVRRIPLRPPEMPFLSNLTGTWIRAEEATDPGYWAAHLRGTVRFAENLREVLADSDGILVEVGPGRALTNLARRHPALGDAARVLPSLSAGWREPEPVALLAALGSLWIAGVEVDWEGVSGPSRPRRVPLPTYPFERRRYWIEPDPGQSLARASAPRRRGTESWFHIPSWKKTPPPREEDPGREPWLIFRDGQGLGARLAERLRTRGCAVAEVVPGGGFRRAGEDLYEIAPGEPGDYHALLEDLAARGRSPRVLAHLWSVTRDEDGEAPFGAVKRLGFDSLLFLAQALGQLGPGDPVCLGIVSTGVQPVTGEERIDPAKALLIGPCRTLPQELPNVRCRSIDVGWEEPGRQGRLVDLLIAELAVDHEEPFVAYRRGQRWAEAFEPVRLRDAGELAPLRRQGVYLITGGWGGMGLELGEALARTAEARLVLVGRTALPPREGWDAWIGSHGEDDLVSRRILKARAIEAAGGEVLAEVADVADPEAMRELAGRIRRKLGRVHGVIHAAGLPPGGVIQTKSLEEAERVLAPKVEGARVLQEVFAGEGLDFLVLCSSLSSILGQAGRIDYCAANAFLDAFAHRETLAGGIPTVSIGWDTWREAGMAWAETVRLGRDPDRAIPVGLSSREGVEVFFQALRSGLPQVVVSVEPLELARERAGRLAASADSRSEMPRRERAHPRPPLSNPFVSPEGDVERAIAAIWEDLLGIQGIGVNDNFFELGADSIVVLQTLARLHQAGLRLTAKQVFECQTVAELAAVVDTGPVLQAEQGTVTGEVPLTPIQHWFFEQRLPDPHHWNQAAFLAAHEDLDPGLLDRAVAELLSHHDALRLRFHQVAEGAWRQVNAAPGGPVPFHAVDLSSLPEELRRGELERAAAALQGSLDLSSGPLLRVALFRSGGGVAPRLLILAHHLVMDAVSRRILLEDLETSYDRLRRGAAADLPPKTTSFRQWALRLREHAQAPEVLAELGYWLDERRAAAPRLPVDFPHGVVSVASSRVLSVALDPLESGALLQEIPRRHRVQVQDVLLTALTLAFRRWTGSGLLLVDLEGHGREAIFDDIDLSRTVGWLTPMYPVLLSLEESGGEPSAALSTIKEQLRAIPGNGLGYGLLRYLGGAESRALRDLPRAEVSFLYLGQLEQAPDRAGAFAPAAEPTGPKRSPRGRRGHALEVSAGVVGGSLRIDWGYSEDRHRAATIERLAGGFLEALSELLARCREVEAVYTPSDFPKAGLSQKELDELLSELDDGQ